MNKFYIVISADKDPTKSTVHHGVPGAAWKRFKTYEEAADSARDLASRSDKFDYFVHVSVARFSTDKPPVVETRIPYEESEA